MPNGHHRANRPQNSNFRPQQLDGKALVEKNSEKITSWIQRGIVNEEAIDFADQFGEAISKSLTTSQLRIFFGDLRKMQINGYLKPDGTSEKVAFLMLKPKLAYAVKRNDNPGMRAFYEFFKVAYEALDKKDDKVGARHFENLMQLMEAIMAYHKFHGGKE